MRRILSLLFTLLSLSGCDEARRGGAATLGSEGSLRSGTPRSLIVLGDTQRTLSVERLLGRESNEAEQPVLIRSMADRSPSLVVLVGDLVNNGGSPEEWQYFDRLISPLRKQETPIFPVMGNHEYWGSAVQGKREREARFPVLREGTWYSRVEGELGLIILDSNRSSLPDGAWKAQAAWFVQTLQRFEQNPSVRAVLVFLHHPPFTNSKVVSDEEPVQQDLVPAFLAAKKAVALFSGHAHGYERFIQGGKHFIVTAGGGGPRQTRLAGNRRRHVDLYEGPEPRPLHYLYVEPQRTSLRVQAIGMQKGWKVTTAFDQFEIQIP